ncbi:type IV pilus modification protein PilV [Catenovulum maritimum]|uniref:Type IV pilin Tt1218-like domain-containing protein n=1 Tax=Catenovulum maritimum TaxID=1513271 RepID=A0A0J8JK90_9ALTE|nr:type IV pilus modification protein PilV [Catenovulum maritimum]KMT64886.1 hypothetical protein XM47_11785 [Catenovulum maritimum]
MRCKNSGFSFVELMIAMAVMAIGIVGAVATQATAKKNGIDATQRSLALYMANDILEKMRLNKTLLESYQGSSYGTASFSTESEANCSMANVCSAEDMVTYDTVQWHWMLKGASVLDGENRVGGLIKPTGCIDHTNGYVTVVVSWLGRKESIDGALNATEFEESCGTGSNKRRQVTLAAHIY